MIIKILTVFMNGFFIRYNNTKMIMLNGKMVTNNL